MTNRRPTPCEIGWTSSEQATGTRVLRLVALLPVMVAVFCVSALSSRAEVGWPFLAALALVLVATLLTFTAPYSRFAPWVMFAIPALDLAAIYALSLEPGMDAVGVLVAVPAMWLGGIFGLRGAVAVAGLSSGGFAVLALLGMGAPLGGGLHAASVITLAVMASVLMAFVVRLTISQLMRMEEQGAELSTALGLAQKHEQNLDGIVDTVDIALATVQPDGTYTSMNRQHRQFLDLVFPDGHAGMAGQVGHVYTADNATPLTKEQLPSSRAARGESFTDCTMWIGKYPLTRRAISASARPMVDGHGDFAGAVLSYHDITDLMTALRVKDDFITLVSHELRTPLTSIMGYLELAAEHGKELPPEVVHYLSVASRNAQRLLRLVTDLLAAGNVDGSGMHLALETVDLSALVQLTLDDIENRIELADLELLVEIEPRVHLVADPGRLMQVVDNLVSNAVKYTLPGGTISVSLVNRGGEVLLCVSDTGIGVSELDQKDLFTKFFQARNATERAISGIGLGLVTCKAIIDAHGGTIRVDSQEDLGTSVRVTLPSGLDDPHTLEQPLTAGAL